MTTIAGLVPFTTIDFPRHLAAVVFFKGCPLKCPFCHNPSLQAMDDKGEMTWADVLSFLSTRKGKLDGLVLSGGEPLMQPDILSHAKAVKEMGFKVAVHTSGVYPEKLAELMPYVDWVGLDIKAPWDKYETLCGRQGMTERIQKSLAILIRSGKDYECRTTCDPAHLTPEDIHQIAKELAALGVETYALQKYHTFEGDKNPPSLSEINAFFDSSALAPVLAYFPKLIQR